MRSQSGPTRTSLPPRFLLQAAIGLAGFAAAAHSVARAETTVGGTVGEVEWTEAGSPYHVTRDVLVPENQTLTIQPGVALDLDPGVSIEVRGTLLAAGSREKGIAMRPRTPGARWGGIVFSGDVAQGTLEHVEIVQASEAKGIEPFPAAVKVMRGAKARIQDSWFHDFPRGVIDSGGGSELEVLDTLIEQCMEAIHSANGYARVEGVHIRDVFGYADCIDYDGDSTPLSVIRNCLIENNAEDDAIDTFQANCLIENVTIRGVRGGKALSLEGRSTPLLSNILIHDCMWGIVSKDSCTPAFRRCTVTRCEKGVYCYEKNGGRGGGGGSGESMIVWGNETEVDLDEISSFAFSRSIVEGGYSGEGNLDVNPLFVEPASDDFHLQAGSPAIGTGRDGEDMGALAFEVPPEPSFVRGRTNLDDELDIGDAVTILLFLFRGIEAVSCLDAFDADDSGAVDVSDAVYLLGYLYVGGTPPPPPFPDPGMDPTGDDPYGCSPAS